ncbi:shikimate O-hydroxycinnamoyltransferase-like [Panicum miliaceum]|uniref:Shikimate O-hydroxycinnamoyltransferase-like n=1 Tax=Panicum miliaceum TaxID=4540 RepID=A0A3L6PKQ1_PANMI|nr:shikimate O-hydroxycinnamoyltransferase-like [Panicum miliaceum]
METTRLHTPADIRSRVRTPLPDGYLGNALVYTTAVAKMEDVISGLIHATAARVAGATARLSDEYIRSRVDYTEECKSYQLGSAMGHHMTNIHLATHILQRSLHPLTGLPISYGIAAHVPVTSCPPSLT